MIKKLFFDTSGATAIEYALIAAGISVAIASIVFTIGSKLANTLYAAVNAMF